MHITDFPKKDKQAIRFGIMCNKTTFHAWESSCLHKILLLENVEASLLIVCNDYLTISKGDKKLRKKLLFKKLFWNIYSLFFLKHLSHAMRPTVITPLLAQVPCIQCKLIRKSNFLYYFSQADVTKIRKYDLDFILNFGVNISGEILKVPRFGVWSFHHDDIEKYRGSPHCFWEIYKDDNITGAILQRITDLPDKSITLRKGFFKTINTSYVRNLDMVYFESTDWPAQVCIDIQNGKVDYLSTSPSKTSASVFDTPTNVQMIFFLLKIVKNYLLKLYNFLFFYIQWNIGIVNKPIHVFITSNIKPPVRWLPAPPWNKLISDPFAVRQGKVVHMLFEDYEYSTSKGSISTMSICGDSFTASKKVISNSYHMSYPYLLEYKNQIYCVPETAERQEVSIYKAKEFPYKWVKKAVLIKDFAGVDNTIFPYNELWWLLATDYNDGPYHKLKAWYAPCLFGPWMPHVANPIKVDIRSARPGGTPFIYDGYLYRPSQDCSGAYGGKIILNRVISLTPIDFKEEQVNFIEPYKNGHYQEGLHTISDAGDITLIDGARKIFITRNLSVLFHKLYNKMIKINKTKNSLKYPKFKLK